MSRISICKSNTLISKKSERNRGHLRHSRTIINKYFSSMLVMVFLCFAITLGILGSDGYFLADADSYPDTAGTLTEYEYSVQYLAGLYPNRTDGGTVVDSFDVNKYIDGVDPSYDSYYLETSGKQWSTNAGTWYSSVSGYNRSNTGSYLVSSSSDESVNSPAAFDPGSASHSYIIIDLKHVVPVSRVIFETIDSSVSSFYFDNILTYGVWVSDLVTDWPPVPSNLNLKTNGYFRNVYQHNISDTDSNTQYYPTTTTKTDTTNVERNNNIRTRKSTNTVVPEFSDEARVMDFDSVYTRYIALQIDECWYLNYVKMQKLSIWGEVGAPDRDLGYMYDVVHAPSPQALSTTIDAAKPGFQSVKSADDIGYYRASSVFDPIVTSNYYTYYYNKFQKIANMSHNMVYGGATKYVLLDLGAVRPISRLQITPSTLEVIGEVEILAATNCMPLDQQPESFFMSTTKAVSIAKHNTGSVFLTPRTLYPIINMTFERIYTRYVYVRVIANTDGISWSHQLSFSELKISDWEFESSTESDKPSDLTSTDMYNLADVSGSYYGSGGYSNYSVAYAPDSEQGNYNASNINDGNNSTIYHSSWETRYNDSEYGLHNQSGSKNDTRITDFNSYIVIDLKETRLVSGITYTRRPDSYSNGTIDRFEIYIDKNMGGTATNVSNSDLLNIGRGNTKFFKLDEGVNPANGIAFFGRDTITTPITFSRLYKARYVVLRATSTWDGNGSNHSTTNNYLSCAELTVQGAVVTKISTKEDLWNNVSSRGLHAGIYVLANDIVVTGKGYNRNPDDSLMNANEISISYGGARHQDKHYSDNNSKNYDAWSSSKNWFTGSLYGNNKTISYNLDWPVATTKPWSDYAYETGNFLASLEREGNSNGEYPNTYHGLLTGQLRGGKIYDLTINVDKSLMLGNVAGVNGMNWTFGIVTGLSRNNSVIQNVKVKLNASVIFAGNHVTDSKGGVGVSLGGFVGQVLNDSQLHNTPVSIINCTFEMASNVALYAATESRVEGAVFGTKQLGSRVGGFIGEIMATKTGGYANTLVVYMKDCKIKGTSTSLIGAYQWTVANGDLVSFAGGIVGNLSRNGESGVHSTLNLDGFIYDFRGTILSNRSGSKGFSGSMDGNAPHGAGLFIGRKMEGCTFNNNSDVFGVAINIYVPEGLNTRIATVYPDSTSFVEAMLDHINTDYRTSTNPTIATKRYIRAFNVEDPFNDTKVKNGQVQMFTYNLPDTLDVGTSSLKHWIGTADTLVAINSGSTSNNKRVAINNIYVGTNKLASSYTPRVTYNSIKDGIIFTTYSMDSGEDVCFSAIDNGGTIYLIYDAVATSWPVFFPKSQASIPKGHAMYYTEAYVQLVDNGSIATLTQQANAEYPEISTLSYSKVYDKKDIVVTYKFENTSFTTLSIVSSISIIETDKSGAPTPVNGSVNSSASYTLLNKEASTHYNSNGYYAIELYDTMDYAKSRTSGKLLYARKFGDGMLFLDGLSIPQYGARENGSVELKITITKKPLSVANATPGPTKTYDGNTTAPYNLTINGWVAGDTQLAITGAGSSGIYYDNQGNPTKDVGQNLTVKYTGLSVHKDQRNYYLGNASQVIQDWSVTNGVINKKNIYVQILKGYSKTYNGLNVAEGFTLSDTGYYKVTDLISTTATHVSATFNTKNAGTNTITVVFNIGNGSEDKNYNLAGTGISGITNSTNSHSFTISGVINKASLSINYTTRFIKVYDANTNASIALNTNYTVAGLVSADDTFTLRSTPTYDSKHVGTDKTITALFSINDGNSGANYAPAVGTNTSTVTGTSNTNYTFTIKGDITVRQITVNAGTPYSRDYNGDNIASVTLNTHYSYANTIESEYPIFVSALFDNKNVGTDKNITVLVNFNDGNPTPGANYKLVNGTATSGGATANSHSFILKGTIFSVSLTITKATNYTKEYNKDYNTPSFNSPTNYTITGFKPGDSASYVSSNFQNYNVGVREIKVIFSISDGNNGNNYTLTAANSSVNTISPLSGNQFSFIVNGTITQKTLTAKAKNPYTKPYDGTNSAAITANTHYEITGFANSSYGSDSFQQTYSAYFDNKNVGTNKDISVIVTISDGNSGDNYNMVADTSTALIVTNATGVNPAFTLKGTITPLAITITRAALFEKTYDSTTTADAFSITTHYTMSNIPLIESSSHIATFDTKHVGTSKVLTVVLTIKATGTNEVTNSNYTLVKGSNILAVETSTLTFTLAANILKRELTVSATSSNYSKPYDDNLTTLITYNNAYYTLVNIATGDTTLVSQTQALFGDKNVGSNKDIFINLSIQDDSTSGNYNLVAGSGTIVQSASPVYAFSIKGSITKVNLTIAGSTSTKFEKVYNKTDSTTITSLSGHYSLDGFQGNDSAFQNSAKFTDTNVGESNTKIQVVLTISDDFNGANYNIVLGSNAYNLSTEVLPQISFNIYGKITEYVLYLTAGNPYTKTYDKNNLTDVTLASSHYTVPQLMGSDQAVQVSATFTDINVGNKTILVLISITDDNNGNNYTLAVDSSSTSSITLNNKTQELNHSFNIPGIITPRSLQVIYDQSLHSVYSKPYNKNSSTEVLQNTHYSFANLAEYQGASDTATQSSALFENVDAGTYKLILITFSITDGNNGKNYTLENAGVVSVGSETQNPYTFKIYGTITRKPITLSKGIPYSKPYDGTTNTVVNLSSNHYSIESLISGDTLTQVSAQFFAKDVIVTDQRVIVVISIQDSSDQTDKNTNYLLTLADGATGIGLTNNTEFWFSASITPKLITITPSAGQQKIYGSPDPSSQSGSAYTFSVSGIITGEVLSYTGSLSRAEGEDVGPYAYNIGSFELSSSGTFIATNYYTEFIDDAYYFNIIQRVILVTMQSTSPVVKSYDGTTQVNISNIIRNTHYTLSNIHNNEAIQISIGSGKYSSKDASATPIDLYLENISLTGDPSITKNYTIASDATILGLINPAQITIEKISNKKFTMTYDGGTDYSGTPPIKDTDYLIKADGVVLSATLKNELSDINISSKTFANKNVSYANNILSVTFNTLVAGSGFKASNFSYTQTILQYDAEVTKCPVGITIKWDYTDSFTYDSSEKIVSVPLTEYFTGIGAEKLSANYSYTNNKKTDVGQYKAEVTVIYSSHAENPGDINNYTVTTYNRQLDWEIIQATIVLTLGTANSVLKNYDGNTQSALAGYVLTGICGEDLIDISGTPSYDTKHAANNKTITINNPQLTGAKSSNYTMTISPSSMLSNKILTLANVGSILPLAVSIKVNKDYASITKYYDGTTALPTAIVFAKDGFYTLSGLLPSEVSYYDASFTAPVYNSRHTDATHVTFVTSSLISTNTTSYPTTNYTFVGINDTVPAKINPAPVTATALESHPVISKTYNGNKQTTTTLTKSYYQLSGFAPGEETYFDILYGTPEYDTKNVSATKVTFTIQSLQSSSLDYWIADYNLTSTYIDFEASITPLVLQVTKGSPYSKEYNGNSDAAITSGSHFTIDPLVTGEDYTIISSNFANKNVSASSNITITLSISDNDGKNYRLASSNINDIIVGDETENNFTFTFTGSIYAKTITINGVTATNRIYDGTTSVQLTGGTLVGIETIDTDLISFSLNTASTDKNVGIDKAVVSAITLEGEASSNYILTQPDYITITISAKTISVSWNYSSPLTFNGETQTITAQSNSTNGVCTGDTITLNLDNNSNRDAGYHTATAIINYDTDDYINYLLDSTASLAYTINPYAIDITNIEVTYSNAVYTWGSTGMIYNGAAHTIAISAVNDSFYNSINDINLTIAFVGLCSCGIGESATYHADHQLALSSTGPVHAGLYWALFSFTGSESANFAFTTEGDGYNATYFEENANDLISLVSVTHDTVDSTLPKTSSSFTGFYNHVIKEFRVSKSFTGVIIDNASPQTVVFNSLNQFVTNLPAQTNAQDISVLIYKEGEDTALLECTFSSYLSEGGLRNAGVYNVVFALSNAASTDSTDCDYTTGIVPSVNIKFTIQPKELRIILTSGLAAPTKVYDASASFTAFSLDTEVSASSSQDNDYKPITGTSIFATASFNSPFVDLANTLTFNLTGTDALNYIIYSIPGTITQKPLNISYPSTNSFEYDGTTKTYNATITGIESSDIPYIQIERLGYSFIASNNYTSSVSFHNIADYDRLSNYSFTIPQLSRAWYITKRVISVTILSSLSKIYDSKTTFEKLDKVDSSYVPLTFTFSNNLVAGNQISGAVGVVYSADTNTLATNAGSHILKVLEDFSSKDGDNNSNYTFNIINNNTGYDILKRKVNIAYLNTLQSLDNVTQISDIQDVILDSITNAYNSGDTILDNEFNTLKAELSSLTVDNITWRTDYASKNLPPYYYFNISLNGETTDIINNYTYNLPFIRIVGFEIKNAETHEFYVKNLNELLNLRYLVDGLTEDGVNYVIYQKADIDGIDAYNGSIYIPAENLTGTYDGGGYTISNLYVDGAGLFKSINGGVVTNLVLRNATISSNSSRVGSVAGTINDSDVFNISFQGTIFITSGESELYAGSIAGYSSNSTFANIEAVGYMFVKSTFDSDFPDFAVGSLIGKYFTDSIEPLLFDSIYSFVDITISSKTTSLSVDGLVGSYDTEILTINGNYLKNSISLNDSILSLDETYALTYSQYQAGANYTSLINLLHSNLLKSYLLADTSISAGTSSNPLKISNFRQLVLMQIYSWASFELLNDIIIPYETYNLQSTGTYYGESYITNGYAIYSSDVSTDIPVFLDTSGQLVIIKKRSGGG
ncbi:MAG: YDG domain-containing protein [Christensenellaceae bacterium]|nr:YDG domain-containing protein [Christensenellaceae bacterium]